MTTMRIVVNGYGVLDDFGTPLQPNHIYEVSEQRGRQLIATGLADQAAGPRMATRSSSFVLDQGYQLIECFGDIAITVPAGMRRKVTYLGPVDPWVKDPVSIAIIARGTVSIVCGVGVLLNGATTTLTRSAANNPDPFWITSYDTAALNTYTVSGT